MTLPVYADQFALGDRLGIAIDDTRQDALAMVIAAASRWVDRQTSRRFYTVTETRYYSPELTYRSSPWSLDNTSGSLWLMQSATWGYGPQRLIVDDVLNVTAVATDQDGDGTYETVWTPTSDYWVGPRNAPARGFPFRTINRNVVSGRFAFPTWGWEDSVSVTGDFGYSASAPDDVVELCLYVAELLGRDVLEMSIPSLQAYELGIDLKVTMASTDLPMVYQKTVEFYRDTPFLQ